MANSLAGGHIEAWSRDMQDKMYKDLMARQVCAYAFKPTLNPTDTFHKPYLSDFHVVDYTKGTDISNRQDATVTDESGSVDQIKCVPLYLDDVDELLSFYSLRQKMAYDMQEDLNRQIDAKVLSEYDNATDDVDSGDFSGGTTGNGHSYSTSDIDSLLTLSAQKLNLNNVKQDNRFAIVGPSQMQLWQDMLSAKDTSFGDQVGATGYLGKRFGFDLYMSNNLTFTARWTPANNPTAADTVTIAGVVFTFATTPSAGGEVDIGGSTAATLDNLVLAINNGTGYAAGAGLATTYFEISTADRAKMGQIVATDGTTYIDIECVGMGEVVVAASESGDVWSKQVLHAVAGRKGCISTLFQKEPGLKVVADPDRLGDNLTAWTLYGVKTFTKDKIALLDVNIDASGFGSSSAA